MNATFLTVEHLFFNGRTEDYRLGVIKQLGVRAKASDFFILQGGFAKSKGGDGIMGACYWTASHISDSSNGIRIVHSDGKWGSSSVSDDGNGMRPVLMASFVSQIRRSKVKFAPKIGDIQVLKYGEYPQTIAAESVSKELEEAFRGKKLGTTDKNYTNFNGEECVEYGRGKKKYVRIKAASLNIDSVLSNGKSPENGDIYWVKVEPIEWLQDPSSGAWLQNIVTCRAKFSDKLDYFGNFEETSAHRFLNEVYMQDIQPSLNLERKATALIKQLTALATADPKIAALVAKSQLPIIAEKATSRP